MSFELYGAMLSYMRPDGSKAERKFIRRFLEPLGLERDEFGNLYKRIGTAPILWSCHTDTVHKRGGKQNLQYGEQDGLFTSDANCLGADCTTGVYLMHQMIKRGVEGLYIFHRAEEVGGQGSSWIAKHNPGVLADIKFAIAFDRKGFTSVITHQFGDRCCSDDFANSLATQLGFGWKLDDAGTFTDTASYVDLVGECTNISVGYIGQHSARETQDWPFMLELLERLCSLDVTHLSAVRQPGETDPLFRYESRFEGYTSWRNNAYGTWDEDDNWRDTGGLGKTYDDLTNAVRSYPQAVADILEQFGITVADIRHVAGGGLIPENENELKVA